ncbi:hypothetical protein EYF80_014492 [Liparis tanakae]|uniref:Secreted protein n=1 Tax=Liparis tanakae TaxID=230148 RepID=A0A4Z2ICN9_9TELE|nr:hypothetical protein EYF80_014492 [Liparis tanakae]
MWRRIIRVMMVMVMMMMMMMMMVMSLGSVKPDIVFELITDAQSATPSLGWDNGASVLCLAQVGTSERWVQQKL